MSKEIEFRAFDKRLGRLLDVDSIDFENNFIMLTDGEVRTSSSFNNCVLEQFTGLYDKNGNKIFEGDIVLDANRLSFDYGKIYTVIFDNYSCSFVIENKNGIANMLSKVKVIELIGNIHDKEVE